MKERYLIVLGIIVGSLLAPLGVNAVDSVQAPNQVVVPGDIGPSQVAPGAGVQSQDRTGMQIPNTTGTVGGTSGPSTAGTVGGTRGPSTTGTVGGISGPSTAGTVQGTQGSSTSGTVQDPGNTVKGPGNVIQTPGGAEPYHPGQVK